MIKSYLKGEQTEWDKNLYLITAAYRSTPQVLTGLTSNLFKLGRETRLPADLALQLKKEYYAIMGPALKAWDNACVSSVADCKETFETSGTTLKGNLRQKHGNIVMMDNWFGT